MIKLQQLLDDGYEFFTTFTLDMDSIFGRLETECEECYSEIKFDESKKVDDDWIRICSYCE